MLFLLNRQRPFTAVVVANTAFNIPKWRGLHEKALVVVVVSVVVRFFFNHYRWRYRCKGYVKISLKSWSFCFGQTNEGKCTHARTNKRKLIFLFLQILKFYFYCMHVKFEKKTIAISHTYVSCLERFFLFVSLLDFNKCTTNYLSLKSQFRTLYNFFYSRSQTNIQTHWYRCCCAVPAGKM